MARPSVDPDWAETLSADPTSGQNNRVEPPAAWKDGGWSYQERPPRNYDNYVKWNLGQWVKYLDQAAVRPATYFVAASDAAAESKYHADAVCDGTDDQVQINAAITSVASAGGGMVLLSEGTFTVSDQISSGSASLIRLQGMGQGGTRIRVVSGDSTTWPIVTIASVTEWVISDLTIDGNNPSVSGSQSGIVVTSCAGVYLRNLAIRSISYASSAGNGIELISGSVLRVTGCVVSDCQARGIVASGGDPTIENCYVTGSAWEGVKLEGANCSLVNCTVKSSGESGVIMTGDYCRVSACRIMSNGHHGISMAGDYCAVGGNIVVENGYHGIYMDEANYNAVVGNICRDNSQDTANTYDGLHLTANADSNVVQGNISRSATDQKYGLNCLSSTNFVVDNYLLGGGVTGALNGSVKTSWGSNQVYDGVSSHVAITGSMVNVVA